MRRLLSSIVCLALGIGVQQVAAQSPGSTNPIQSRSQPSVTLGPPSVSLGAPRVAQASGHSAEGMIIRAKADDKVPLPAGPSVTGDGKTMPLHPPAPVPSTVTTPMPSPVPMMPGSPVPMMQGAPVPMMPGSPVPGMSMPPPNGPIVSGPSLPGAPCESCGNGGPVGGYPMGDASMAPLPGGVFVPPGFPAPYMLYGSAEYLLWSTSNTSLPPLLITGPSGSNLSLGSPGSQVLYGGNSIDSPWRSGARFTAGYWFTPCQNWGLLGSVFFLNQSSQSYAISNPGVPLARPYIDPYTTDPLTGAILSANPQNVAEQGVTSFSSTLKNSLWGADINVRKGWLYNCNSRIDFLAGFRYLNFQEDLTINETFAAPSRLIPGTSIPTPAWSGSLTDQFGVTNDFYGAQFGLIGEKRHGRWGLEWLAKVAVGTTVQTVNISGSQSGNVNGVPFTGPGFLAQPSNIGSHSRNEFSVVPEVGLNLAYYVTPRLKVFVGYNVLYWSNMLRAGDQIDPVLNIQPTVQNGFRVPPLVQRDIPPARPAVPFTQSDFWAQGMNLGLQFNW